jgi:(2R)-3-sulfolactate dehydrogenase (NADP+)
MALGFSNSPAAIAPWGGNKGSFGTNPIAFACPRAGQPPLVIDLSLSTVARGKIMLAAQRGETIPDDWAQDAQGRPTTDPRAALAGTMQPLGGAKGAALALMVEILTASLTGANPAFRASSFFETEGPPPGVGQLFLVFDPRRFNPDFDHAVAELLAHVLDQDGTRLPGSLRLQCRERSRREGILLPATLLADLRRRVGS